MFITPAHSQASGPCNLGMPNSPSVYDRFMWYLRLLTYNGFVVVIDNHLNDDPTITLDADLWLKVRYSAVDHHNKTQCVGLSPTHSQATSDCIKLPQLQTPFIMIGGIYVCKCQAMCTT